jgi:hypothetical protein
VAGLKSNHFIHLKEKYKILGKMQIFCTSNRSTCGKISIPGLWRKDSFLDEFKFRLIILHAFFPHDVMSVTEHNTAFSELIAPRSLLGRPEPGLLEPLPSDGRNPG